MTPEKHNLIRALSDESAAARREAILGGGGRILRRRRWRRRTMRGLASLAVCVLAVTVFKMNAPQPQVLPSVVVSKDEPRSLTDSELLALFPSTPVGLITLENGKKRLIFLRPGDEKRYVAQY